MSSLILRLRDFWTNLSAREQILVGAVASMSIFALLYFGIIIPIADYANRASERIVSIEQQINAMQRLRSEHAEIQSRLFGVEERIRNQRGQPNIRTLLETLAKQSEVRIDSMEERQAGKNDHYVETKVEVALKDISLSQAITYLHNIEASDQQLSVKSLRIKGRNSASDEQTLDVTFSVSSFEAI